MALVDLQIFVLSRPQAIVGSIPTGIGVFVRQKLSDKGKPRSGLLRKGLLPVDKLQLFPVAVITLRRDMVQKFPQILEHIFLGDTDLKGNLQLIADEGKARLQLNLAFDPLHGIFAVTEKIGTDQLLKARGALQFFTGGSPYGRFRAGPRRSVWKLGGSGHSQRP